MRFAALALVACNGGNKDTDTTGTTGDTGPTTPGVDAITIIGDSTNLPADRILSIWGTDSSNVWMVGGDPGDGLGPLVIHWDGTAWSRLETGTTGDLWWVWSDGGDTVLLSGDGGRMLTHSIAAGTFTEDVITNPVYKLFGTWGTSPTDVWTVGGDVNNGLDGIALHYDGTAWTEMFTAPADPANGVTRRQTFKVWGAGTDDVWFIGTAALVEHWDGAAVDLSYDQPVYHSTPFVTVHGRSSSDAFIVGGYGNGAVVHWDGASWVNESPPPTAIAPGFNGVFASQAGETVTCGLRGSIWWRDGTGQWAADPRPTGTTLDFHACWIDETGEPWAVGGDLTGGTQAVVVTGNPSIPPIAL